VLDTGSASFRNLSVFKLERSFPKSKQVTIGFQEIGFYTE